MRTLAATFALLLIVVNQGMTNESDRVDNALKFKIISKGKLVAEWFNPDDEIYTQTYSYKGKFYGCAHQKSGEFFYVICYTDAYDPQ